MSLAAISTTSTVIYTACITLQCCIFLKPYIVKTHHTQLHLNAGVIITYTIYLCVEAAVNDTVVVQVFIDVQFVIGTYTLAAGWLITL